MSNRVNLVVYPTNNLQASEQFFSRVFSMEPTVETPYCAGLDEGARAHQVQQQ